MAKTLHIGRPHRWNGTPVLVFTDNQADSISLATWIHNPQSFALTYTIASGSLPSGVTLVGSNVVFDGNGTPGETAVSFNAFDGSRTVQSPQTVVDILPDAVVPPAVPVNVQADGLTQTTIRVIWTPGVGGPTPTSYVIRRATSMGGTYSQVGEVTGSPFDDDTLSASQTFWYTVASKFSGVESAQSTPDAGTTLDPPTGDAWPTQTPAYLAVVPNLAGYGADTMAGYGVNARGDNVQVVYVTDIRDNGSDGTPIDGSLRHALVRNDLGGAARVIVFNVGGYIDLQNDMWQALASPITHVTIAGQTAPGLGICCRFGEFWISSNHVLVQHMRFRIAQYPPVAGSAVNIFNWQNNSLVHHVVVDHCTVGWNADESISVGAGASDVTIANCFTHQPLTDGGGGGHGMFLDVNPSPGRVSVVRSLIHNAVQRNPLIRCNQIVMVNNLVYNWGVYGSDMQSDPSDSFFDHLTAIGNHYKRGPNWNGSSTPMRMRGGSGGEGSGARFSSSGETSTVYAGDNRLETTQGNSSVPADQRTLCTFVSPHSASHSGRVAPYNYTVGDSAIPTPAWSNGIVPAASADVFDLVTQGVGAKPTNRDPLDIVYINDVINRTATHGYSTAGLPAAWPSYGTPTWDHRTQHNYPSGTDPIPDGLSGRPSPGTINGATGRTLIEEWCQRRADEVEVV